jgi:hypothetical protein
MGGRAGVTEPLGWGRFDCIDVEEYKVDLLVARVKEAVRVGAVLISGEDTNPMVEHKLKNRF